MRVLIIQNKVYKTIKENINHLQVMLDKIPVSKVDFIVFPEMFTTPYEMNFLKNNQQSSSGEVIQFLQRTARKYQAYIIGGSIPENDQEKLYNTCFVLNRQGLTISKYRKIHLFSVIYPDGTKFDEAHTLSKGSKPITFETEFGTMGLMICFDIRFPLLSRKLRNWGSKILFIPAAFNTYTGPLHWHTTFKARAIDNQLFVIGASPARESYGEYEPYGHSLVVDPLGQIINELDENEGYLIVDIDLENVEKARKTIPIVKLDKGEQAYENL